MTARLLDATGRNPLNGQTFDGRVVNVRVSADEEHDVFVAGRFQRLTDADAHRLQRGDLLESNNHPGTLCIFHVAAQSLERLSGNWRDFCVVVSDPADAAGSENMLAVQHGVVKQKLDAINDVLDQVALNHVFVPSGAMVVCESEAAARTALQAYAEKARPSFADTAIMTSAVVLIALLIAAGFNRNAEAFDAGMRAQCRADQNAAAVASALIALADASPEIADQLDDQIAHLVDMTGGRTPEQIANLPQCRGV